MNKLTKTAIAPLIGLSLLVSGCSTPAPDYDQLDLIAWEVCLKAYENQFGSESYFNRAEMVEKAKNSCKDIQPKPIKK